MINISYTMLHSIMHCEYMYYLRYIEKVQLVESSASVYGTAIHRTIKIAYENNLDDKEMAAVFKREWIQLASAGNVLFLHDKDYMTKLTEGQKLVSKYYKKFIKDTPPPKKVECFIGKREGIKLGKYNVVAVFDQISHDDMIIDLKTGVKPTQLQLDLDLQFTIYSYVYRQLYGEPESGLVLRHMSTMKDVVTTRSETDFEILLDEVNKLESKLESKVFLRNLDRDCGRCYFLEHCLGKEKQVGRRKW